MPLWLAYTRWQFRDATRGLSWRQAICKLTLDICKVRIYSVIRSFRSKALKKFWTDGDRRLLPVENQDRVRRQLLALDAASVPEDMNLPGFRFHGLNTAPKRWSISVSGNYRITFGWDGADAVDVDIEDYH